jgi:cytosine/adenosine deaminase-related metal-dependent hydrolase
MRTTVIHASWIVAYQDGEHRILHDGVVAFRGDRIIHVGQEWSQPADIVVHARGKLVIPGLISTHGHISAQAGDRLVLDGGRRDLLRSGFLNYVPRRLGGGPGFSAQEDADASIAFAFYSLLRGGVTTVVEGGNTAPVGEAMVRLASESGIRLYYSPAFAGGEYFFEADGRLQLVRDERMGLEGLERAIEFIGKYHNPDNRFHGILNPDEFYLSTPRMLCETKRAARDLGVGITLHFSEQLFEFHDTLRTTSRTPVGVLAELDFLGPEVILGHCIYLSGHSMTGYPYGGDLETLASSSCTVAHSPVPLARRGIALQSFQRYLDHGINLSIGTDSYPNDILGEMRLASYACKIVEGNHEVARAGDIFNAATLGGARALQRYDLGRLEAGAKADIVIVDFNDLAIGPVWDPIRALIHCATPHLIDTVIVDGATRVMNRELVSIDQADLLARVRQSTARVWGAFPTCHWSGRGAEDEFPVSLGEWKEPRESIQ